MDGRMDGSVHPFIQQTLDKRNSTAHQSSQFYSGFMCRLECFGFISNIAGQLVQSVPSLGRGVGLDVNQRCGLLTNQQL